MGNTVYIESTEFKPLKGKSTFGYIICDRYNSDYYILCEEMLSNNVGVLKLAFENQPEFFEDNTFRQVVVNGESFTNTDLDTLFNKEPAESLKPLPSFNDFKGTNITNGADPTEYVANLRK